MSDMLIRGMELPSCCMFCPISNATGCGLMNPPVLMTSKEMLQGRPDWCPLIPVPAHGRLIDADVLKKQGYFFPCAIGTEYAIPLRALREAPTVIPAEEVQP